MDRETRRPIYTRRTGSGTRCPKVVINGARAVVAYESGGDLQVDSYNLTTYTIAETATFAGALLAGTALDMRTGAIDGGATYVSVLYRAVGTGILMCTELLATALATNDTYVVQDTGGTVNPPDLGFGWLQDLGGSGTFSIMYAETTLGLLVLWDMQPSGGGFSLGTLHSLDPTANTAPSGATAGVRNLIGTTYDDDPDGAYKVLYEITAPLTPTWAEINVARYLDGELTVTGTPYMSVGIRSKFWEHAGSYYFLSAFDGTDQRSYFVLAMAADGETTATTFPAPLAVANVRDAGGLTEATNAPSSAVVGADGEIYIGVTSETRVESITAAAVATGATKREFAIEVVRIRHPAAVETELSKPVEFLRSLFTPGGLLGQFDGSFYATAGFAYYPPAFTLVAQAGGDLTPDGVYFWKALYSYVDRNGRKWRSAPTAPITATASGGIEQYDVVIDTLRLYDRGLPTGAVGGFQIEVYRTQANADAAYFLVATVHNDPTSNTVTFRDNVADTALGEQLYTDGGGVENQLLPSIAWCVEQEGRLVCGEAGTGTVWESVEADFQSGLIFNEALTFDVGDPSEPTTGAAVFGQTLFVFKEGKTYAVDGRGANALGQGSTRTVRLLDGGIGCDNPQSIVVGDDGVWFRSSSDRAGMHRTAGGAPQYVGGGVRAYDTLTISSAVVVRKDTQIRWFTQEGTTLVWDWTAKIWSTNTGQACLSATTGYAPVPGVVYARTTGAVYSEATATSDEPYREGGAVYFGRIRSPWYQVAGISGWERIKRIQGVGVGGAAHIATVTLYKNLGPSFQSVQRSFDGSDVQWNWELRPSQQKVSSLMVEIGIAPYQPATVTASITPSSAVDEPPALGDMVLWLDGLVGMTQGGGVVTAWDDQSGNNHDATNASVVGLEPAYIADGIDGVPGIVTAETKGLNNQVDTLITDGGARTVVVICKPSSSRGGVLMAFRRTSNDHAVMLWTIAGTQYVWADFSANRNAVTPVDHTDEPIMVKHVATAGLVLTRFTNGAAIPLNSSAITADTGFAGFAIGNRQLNGFVDGQGFVGVICEVMVWDRELTSIEDTQLDVYVGTKYPSIVLP